MKTDGNVNDDPPGETLEGGQAFDSIPQITADDNLQVNIKGKHIKLTA